MSERRPEFIVGEGKISGYLSVFLGGLGLATVLCFHFPDILTTPILREKYPIGIFRIVLAAALALSTLLGALSFALDSRRWSGKLGLALSALGTYLGGATIHARDTVPAPRYFGLDWFVLDLLILGMLFVPLERLFPHRTDQPVFREGWRTDLFYFFVAHVLIQMTVFVSMAPAKTFFDWALDNDLRRNVAALPLWAQFLLAMFAADLTQYWVHRAFHAIPALWRFHAVHHSASPMDWLAGSRLHLVDILATRALGFVPLYLLGITLPALNAYLVFVAFHTVLIHANVRLGQSWWGMLIATPYFHHWHHSAEPGTFDKNFAVHLPLFDYCFGTAFAPGRWPKAYGLGEDKLPRGWLAQFVWPFRRR